MDTKPESKLAANLTRLMAERDIKLTTLAKKVGTNKSTLHGYCNGILPKHIVTMKKLADFFGVSFENFLFNDLNLAVDQSAESSIEGRYEVVIRRVVDNGKTIK